MPNSTIQRHQLCFKGMALCANLDKCIKKLMPVNKNHYKAKADFVKPKRIQIKVVSKDEAKEMREITTKLISCDGIHLRRSVFICLIKNSCM